MYINSGPVFKQSMSINYYFQFNDLVERIYASYSMEESWDELL